MSAASQSGVGPSLPEQLGIIAGGGALPARLVQACLAKGIKPFIIAFDGQTDPRSYEGQAHLLTRLGAAGQIIETLKNHNIRDLVLIGSIRRPSLAEMKPDLRTAQFFAKIGLKALGDDGLLTALKHELQEDGFTLHGVQDFIDDLLVPVGVIGKHKPSQTMMADITRGLIVSQALGAQDVGQSVIVQEGIVLGVEAIEGTDELIRRCQAYKRDGRGGVLVKSCKPQQDKTLDLPTIGPDTVRLAAETGLSGIAVQAGAALLSEPDAVKILADQYKIFVIGIERDERKA